MAELNLSKLADGLKPYLVPWVRSIAAGSGGSSGGGASIDLTAHELATTSALGTYHTVSGLTAGQVLKATGSTTAAFGTLSHTNLGDLTSGDPHTQYALRSITVTGSGALGGGGSLASNQAITLNTPGTLTVSSSNSSASAHTHAITSSANPGAAASILASDASGFLSLVKLRTPALDTSAGHMTIAPADNLLLNPTGDYVVPVTNYDINLGAINYKYLTLHAAELWVETLVAQNTIATIGGRILVGPTTTLVQDWLDGAGNTTIHVKYNNLNVGDICYLEASGKVEFIEIAGGPTGSAGDYSYTVYRNLDPSGRNLWYAGDAVFNTGQTGNGFIDLYSLRGVKSETEYGPTIVGNRRMSSTYNDWEPRWAIGNLRGLYGYGSETYGFAAGQYSSTWLGVDATNGLRMMRSTTARLQIDTSGNLRIKNNAGADVIALDNDGSSYFAGVMTIGTSGEIRQGTGTLGSNYTGLRIWRDSNVGLIGGYNNNTIQWQATTAGRLTAGSAWLDAAGLSLSTASAFKQEGASVAWRDSVGGATAAAITYWNASTVGHLELGFDSSTSIDIYAGPTGEFIDLNAADGVFASSLSLTGGVTLGAALNTASGTALSIKQDGNDILYSTPAAESYLNIGKGRSGDYNAVLRLIGDTTYSLYGAALLRQGGANGATQFLHRGTGNLDFVAVEAAGFTIRTNNTTRMTIDSAGLVGIGVTPATQKLKVLGSVAVGGDDGGTASYTTLTNATVATSSGTGTVKMNDTSSRNNAGLLKVYIGTTVAYIPYWT